MNRAAPPSAPTMSSSVRRRLPPLDLADKQMQVERASAELGKTSKPASPLIRVGAHLSGKQLALSAQRDALAKRGRTWRPKTHRGARSNGERGRAPARRPRARPSSKTAGRSGPARLPAMALVQMAVNPTPGENTCPAIRRFQGGPSSLSDLSSLQVHARLSDVDDGAIEKHNQSRCTVDALPRQHFRGGTLAEGVSPMARLDGRDIDTPFLRCRNWRLPARRRP